MNKIEFFIPGEPVAKGRPRARIQKKKDGQQFVLFYTPKETKEWEARVETFARIAKSNHEGESYFEDCPLRVNITFCFTRPQSHTRKQKASCWQFRKPDRDNLEKSILDALEGIFFKNDSQICDGRVKKIYADERVFPGVYIEIEEA